MSRDFVGALLQLNAEKQVSREQLIGAVEDGIQSAYRRVAGARGRIFIASAGAEQHEQRNSNWAKLVTLRIG